MSHGAQTSTVSTAYSVRIAQRARREPADSKGLVLLKLPMQGDGGVQKGGECGRHSRASKVRLCILPFRDSGKSHQLRALQEEVWVWVFMLSQRPLGFVVLLLCFIF